MDTPSIARLIGYIAGTLTTLAFVPQVVRTWRQRSADHFSLAMLVAFNVGVGLWLVYGVLLHEPPIVLFNAITLALALFLLWMKLKRQR
jgi:MtN3 and saliva related transmembrane protein